MGLHSKRTRRTWYKESDRSRSRTHFTHMPRYFVITMFGPECDLLGSATRAGTLNDPNLLFGSLTLRFKHGFSQKLLMSLFLLRSCYTALVVKILRGCVYSLGRHLLTYTIVSECRTLRRTLSDNYGVLYNILHDKHGIYPQNPKER